MLLRFQYPTLILLPETLESAVNCPGLGCTPLQINVLHTFDCQYIFQITNSFMESIFGYFT